MTTSTPAPTMPPNLNLQTLFTSLSTKNWTLLRVLKSANPHDINGNLHGTASFTSLPDTTTTTTQDPPAPQRQLLYTETGTLPPHIGHNLQWKKSYIWRLKSSTATSTATPTSTVKDDLSVWFVKVGDEKVADYLFHGMEFLLDSNESGSGGDEEGDGEEFVSAPVPPSIPGGGGRGGELDTVVVTARGNHLCINDMYRTAYAFRVVKGDGDGDGDGIGEVVSWASRHVVKGPKKDQDIVNYYTVREGV